MQSGCLDLNSFSMMLPGVRYCLVMTGFCLRQTWRIRLLCLHVLLTWTEMENSDLWSYSFEILYEIFSPTTIALLLVSNWRFVFKVVHYRDSTRKAFHRFICFPSVVFPGGDVVTACRKGWPRLLYPPPQKITTPPGESQNIPKVLSYQQVLGLSRVVVLWLIQVW